MGDPLGFLKVQFAAKYQKKLKGNPLETKNIEKIHFKGKGSDEKHFSGFAEKCA